MLLRSWQLHVTQAAHIDGLMQERRNSIAKALELRLSCTQPSISSTHITYPIGRPWG